MSSILLKNATLVDLNPPRLEKGDLRLVAGKIAERGKGLRRKQGETVVDLEGKHLLPGMVCAHTHLYSALACGMPLPRRSPKSFLEILQKIWWRLDWAHDEETIYYSALVGAMDAALSGTTLLIDHHASPCVIKGSLKIIQSALEAVGLRGVLCYEVTDRGGMRERDAGLEENVDFISAHKEHPRFRGLFGAHASFTLGNESLRACTRLANELKTGLHIHMAEDLLDVRDAKLKYSRTPLERLEDCGGLHARTLLAHGTHLSSSDIRRAGRARAWIVHNPRSNMNNAVGYAAPARMGDRVALGTDGISANVLDELKFAFFRWRDSMSGTSSRTQTDGPRSHTRQLNVLSLLTNSHALANEVFGAQFGTLKTGAEADLVVMDYSPATPLTPQNLASHLLFGMNPSDVDSVLVAGRFVLRNRRFPRLDIRAVHQKAAHLAQKLWDRAF